MTARRIDPTIRRLQARLHRWELPHLRELCAQQAQRIEDLERQLAAEQDAHSTTWHWLEQEREANDAMGVQRSLSQQGDLRVTVVAPSDMPIEALQGPGVLSIQAGNTMPATGGAA